MYHNMLFCELLSVLFKLFDESRGFVLFLLFTFAIEFFDRSDCYVKHKQYDKRDQEVIVYGEGKIFVQQPKSCWFYYTELGDS